MAYSIVSNDGRLNLHKDFCFLSGIKYGRGENYYITNLSDNEQEFDVVNTKSKDGVYIKVTADKKCRIELPSWMSYSMPGTRFNVTYQKGVIHFRQYDNPLDLYRDTKKGVG